MSRLRHITRIPALVISFVVVGLSVAAVAIGADNLIVDGDTLTDFTDSDMIFTGTVPCNADTSRNARLALRHQGGGQVFDNGSTVTVSAQSSNPAVTAADHHDFAPLELGELQQRHPVEHRHVAGDTAPDVPRTGVREPDVPSDRPGGRQQHRLDHSLEHHGCVLDGGEL